MLEIVRPAFFALRWLNTARFDDSAEIAAAISELEQQVEALANYCPRWGENVTPR